MSKPKRYLPFAASSSKRPLIPEGPIPTLRPLARAIRDAMGGGRAPLLALGARAFYRIRKMMEGGAA